MKRHDSDIVQVLKDDWIKQVLIVDLKKVTTANIVDVNGG